MSIDGILKVVTWPTGVALLTRSLQVWVVTDLDRPICEQLADIGVDPASIDVEDLEDAAMEVVPPELSADMMVDAIISLPGSKNVYITNIDSCQKVSLTNTPFNKIAASPQGNAFATFTEQGGLWVVKSDFTENHPEFTTRSKSPPAQLNWCGEDSVCLQWSPEQLNRDDLSLLLMIGPNGDFYKKTYDGPIHLVSEIDGIRIITNDTCEFLQRVPSPTLEIFRIGSLEPAAMLFDAYKEFEKKNASSIKNIRSIKNKPRAVQTCLRSACHEFDPELQRKLLKAASYGKSFCEYFKHSDFIATCKKIRVMNAIRDPEIGIPITSEQFDRLTPEVIVDRLVNRFHHLLAFKVCEYMEMKDRMQNVLVHWACAKVRSYAHEVERGTTNQTEREIIESIQQKLSKAENASYAIVASTAYRAGHKDLATALLEFEKNAGEQVPLLLDMKEVKRALKKAIESGETDLVYLVLLHMKKRLEPRALFQMINEPGFEVAKHLFISYCKEQDIGFLSTYFQAQDMPHEAAAMKVMQAYITGDPSTRRKDLQLAAHMFSKSKLHSIDTKATEDQIELDDAQTELDKAVGKRAFVGGSIGDTIYRLILVGQDQQANRLKSQFKVSDKLFWHVRVRALAKARRWEELDKFARAKKSPIGYRPFVEACLQHDSSKAQAARYIPRLSDPWEKAEMYVAVGKFKEAIETAFGEKDTQMLAFIRSKSNNLQTRQTIDGLIQKLGG